MSRVVPCVNGYCPITFLKPGVLMLVDMGNLQARYIQRCDFDSALFEMCVGIWLMLIKHGRSGSTWELGPWSTWDVPSSECVSGL